MVSGPLFGDIQDPTTKKDIKGFKPSSFAKAKSTPTYHGSSFATITTSEVSAKTQPLNQDKPVAVVPKPCLVCNEDHAIESCQEIIKKPNKERVEILKKKGICFGCLIRRHMSKGCRRQTCSVCSQRLPSILHIQRNEAEKFKKENVKESDKTSVGSGLVSLATHGLESSDQHCTLPIVPVQVKLSNSNHIIQTYAFLDQGSSAIILYRQTEKTTECEGQAKLNPSVHYGTEQTCQQFGINGLEVCGLDGNKFIRLPEVHSQEEIPATKDHILNRKKCRNGLI